LDVDQHVDAGFVEQSIESGGIEGKGLADRRLCNSHGFPPKERRLRMPASGAAAWRFSLGSL